MLLKQIERMRKKSFPERQRATLVLSIFVTAIIVFVWATTILPQTITMNRAEVSRADSATPLRTLFEDLGIIWSDIRAGIDQVGSAVTEIVGGVDESLTETPNEALLPATSTRGDDLFPEERGTSFGSQDGAGISLPEVETPTGSVITNESASSQDEAGPDI